MRSLILSAALALGLTGSARAADTYDLRGPAPTKGATYQTEQTFVFKDGKCSIKVGEQTIEFTQTTTSKTSERVKFLAVDGRTVTKAEKRFVKDNNVTEVSVAGMDRTETKSGPLEGETVISTRGDDEKWTNKLVDNTPTDKQKKKLDKLRGPLSDDDLYPAEKVAVGHAWTVDAKTLGKHLGDDFTDLKGKVDSKFVRVEKIDGEECAVVETKGKITGKSASDEEEAEGILDVELTVNVTVYRSLKTGVDVKDSVTGKMKLSGTVKVMGSDAEMTVSGNITSKGTQTVVKPAKE
jgi:hypothetical protein